MVNNLQYINHSMKYLHKIIHMKKMDNIHYKIVQNIQVINNYPKNIQTYSFLYKRHYNNNSQDI